MADQGRCGYCWRTVDDMVVAELRVTSGLRSMWEGRATRLCPSCRKYLRGLWRYWRDEHVRD